MYRLRCALFVLVLGLFAVTSTSGQDKKPDKEDPKAKGSVPAGWKSLDLTAEQKQKIYKVHADFKPKIDELEKKLKELKEEEYAEKVKVLTDDQKKKLKDAVVPDDKDKPKDKPTDKDKPTADKEKPSEKDKPTDKVPDKDKPIDKDKVKDKD